MFRSRIVRRPALVRGRLVQHRVDVVFGLLARRAAARTPRRPRRRAGPKRPAPRCPRACSGGAGSPVGARRSGGRRRPRPGAPRRRRQAARARAIPRSTAGADATGWRRARTARRALAGGPSLGEQQARDVRAGDEHHHADTEQQQRERVARAADDIFEQRHGADVPRPSSPLRIRADTAARSARACRHVTPGFNRATALM